MSKGFGGMPGNLQEIMKKAQKMQEQLQKAQEKSEHMFAESSTGGGMVKAVANGKNVITSLTIDKEVVNADDVEMLQDLILSAINEALRKVQDEVRDEMSKVTGGMGNIPGLF